MTVMLLERGRIVPRGRGLFEALAAGLLWLPAVVLLVTIPGKVRFAHLYAQWAKEGIGWFQVFVVLVAVGALLSLATRLSWRAHGKGGQAPRLVRTVRGLTWSAFGALGVGILIVEATWADTCFRTCAPFPH